MTTPSPQFEPRGWIPFLFREIPGRPFRLVSVAFVFASIFHLWLEDASSPDWMPANIIYVLGILVMVIRPGLVSWLLSAIGLAIPLLFHRDQLTQSVLLIFVCVAAIVGIVRNYRGADDAQGTFLKTIQGLTIATYSLATFHKLNWDFIHPATSCANYGMVELGQYYNMPIPDVLAPLWPWVALSFEASIAFLFARGRHRLAWWVGVIFHIPLTLTMAPAFFFVMIVGWASFVTPDDMDALNVAWSKHFRWLVPTALAILGISLTVHGARPEPLMIPREGFLWLLLLWLPVAFGWRGLVARHVEPDRVTSWTPRVLVGLFFLNGLTPYVGIQFQHAGAMLSNLRIDDGCWNHMVVPEAMRLTEDYVRIDEGWFKEPGYVEEYEHIMKDQLWNPPQIRQMQRNWCKHDVRPLYIRGTYRGRTFEVADICPKPGSSELPPLPFGDDGVFGVELFLSL
ncbi:MAG: hypothetical protein R3E66_13485 [bacterium]